MSPISPCLPLHSGELGGGHRAPSKVPWDWSRFTEISGMGVFPAIRDTTSMRVILLPPWTYISKTRLTGHVSE